jgi:hypothetical protein
MMYFTINMNPEPPNLHAIIKLHKPSTPIRPIMNWKKAPAYEVAKHLSQTLHNYLLLPYKYNTHNSVHQITGLKTTEISKDTRICSFDIENMYTNIPKIDTTNVITNILKINSSMSEIIQTKKYTY